MKKIINIHLLGIGGSGMSGIAEVLLNQKYNVSGSDLQQNATTNRLQKLGAKIFFEHNPKNIKNVDIIVASTAISPGNPELVAAHKALKPILSRAQMLAELMRFHRGIAISGTHGKTTTTSLIASILAEGKLDPTFVIGGLLNSIGSHAKLGTSRYFVAEADESDASFLRLQPMISIVTNIEPDHMQTYGNDFAKLKKAFISFLHNLPFYGLAIVCIDDPTIKEIMPEIARPTITYGFNKKADYWVKDYKQKGMTCQFKVQRKNKASLDITLNLPGQHNVLNALAAIALGDECKIPDRLICKALANFKGVGRRLQVHGELPCKTGTATLIDDYGHHPSEIKASLEALRKAWPKKRLVVAFQPHRYSRTKDLFEDFAKILSETDILLLLEVYSAGEQPITGINGRSLAHSIRQRGKVDPIFVEKIDELPKTIQNILQHDDVLLMQGAGNIGAVAKNLKQYFNENPI